MAKGRREGVYCNQLDCKKPRVLQPLDPFTLRPKSEGRGDLKCLRFDEGDGLSKEVWVGREWKPKL